MKRRGHCLWCGCTKAVHDGRVPQVSRIQMFGKVKWSTTACSNLAHERDVDACRRYEV